MAINSQNPPKTADRTIDKFKSRLSGGIARPNLFEVVLAWPEGVVDASVNDIDAKARFLVKAAALPASNIAPISVPFRGRTLKILVTEHSMSGPSQLSTILTLQFVLPSKDG